MNSKLRAAHKAVFTVAAHRCLYVSKSQAREIKKAPIQGYARAHCTGGGESYSQLDKLETKTTLYSKFQGF